MPKVDVAWDRARDRVLELGTVCSSFWIYGLQVLEADEL
jgi:hypothetical protein